MSKIKKIEKDEFGRFEVLDLLDKVNEIIDVLNKSFITNDPDTVYEEVGGPIKVDPSLFSISCDRLTPLDNETTCKLAVGNIYNMFESEGLYSDIKCPKCGAKHFVVGPSTTTCVYYPPIIKDGKNINPDRNTCTNHYECMECGNMWEE